MAKTVGNVTFDNGAITVAGRPVGRADQELKHGYHPAVKLTVEGQVEWFELDTPDLTNVLFSRVWCVDGALDATALLYATNADAAKQVKLKPGMQSDAGFYWPSVEFFVDSYLQNTVGFNSSYPDQKVVDGWIAECLAETADYLGYETMLYMQALCDTLNAHANAVFLAYIAKHGERQWFGDKDPTDKLFIEVCDMVRAFVGVPA